MKEMETMRNQVIDQMVDDILAKRELLDYFVSTVMESIPHNNRKDRKLCENIVNFTMDEALKDSRVLQLIQTVVSRPTMSHKKSNKKSKRRPKPRSPIHAPEESTEDAFKPSFSLTEPIRLEPESSKRKMKKLKTSELLERRNKELREQCSEVEPSNTEKSDLNATGTLTFNGKDVLFKLKDKHSSLPTENSFSALDIPSEEGDLQDRLISDLNSSCSTINNNVNTEGNVDIYASSDDDHFHHTHGGGGGGTAVEANGEEDDVDAYLSAWENRVQNNLAEDNLEEGVDEDYYWHGGSGGHSGSGTGDAAPGGLTVECEEYQHEEEKKKEPTANGKNSTKEESIAAASQPYSLSSTLLSGTTTSTSNMLFFDQSTFDSEVDHLQSGKKEPFHRRKVSFSKHLVSGIQYRDKVSPEEKQDMFYNHTEEFRFTRDQSREFAKAEAAGLTWNQWIEQRSDEEAERDEAEAAAAAEEEGDMLYFDDYGELEGEGEEEQQRDYRGGVMMYFDDFIAQGAALGEDQWAYDAETGFTDLLDAGGDEEEEEEEERGSESESEGEEQGEEEGLPDDSFERRRISGSNDESDWQGAVVYERSATSSRSRAKPTATTPEGDNGLEIVFETDDTTESWRRSVDSSGGTDWQTMPMGQRDDGDESSSGDEVVGSGGCSSMDTLEDGQPAQRTTVSKIQKMMRASLSREETAGAVEEQEEEGLDSESESEGQPLSVGGEDENEESSGF